MLFSIRPVVGWNNFIISISRSDIFFKIWKLCLSSWNTSPRLFISTPSQSIIFYQSSMKLSVTPEPALLSDTNSRGKSIKTLQKKI